MPHVSTAELHRIALRVSRLHRHANCLVSVEVMMYSVLSERRIISEQYHTICKTSRLALELMQIVRKEAFPVIVS